MKGISLIICCYNSAKRLPSTLEYIVKQKVSSSINWEVIIVNNASTDDTESVAKNFWATQHCNVPLNIVFEPMAGLSNARKKGVEVANFEYLIFCDDDNWLDENYVSSAFAVIDSNPLIALVGGKISAVYDVEPETWLIENQDLLAVGPKEFCKDGDISESIGLIYGAGMVIRKEIFTKVQQNNYQFILTDRQGDNLSSCGDGELCFIARLLGYRIYFSNQLALQHNIPANRTSWQYLIKLIYGLGHSGILLMPYVYALQNKEVTGFEKIRTHWIWQLSSIYKEIFKDYLYFLFNGLEKNRRHLGYYERKGRAKGLWSIKNKYRLIFNQVEQLVEKIEKK